MKLYNTLTRKKEEFTPIQGKSVRMYACGPTVYWFAHIGNMRAFLFADVLHRALIANGYDVNMVMNITDVGHLTDDASDGEDKMIVAMKREGKTAKEISEFYTQAFFDDVKTLNVLPASVYPKATEHIQEQIDMVVALEEKGYAYRTDDGIYFDTAALPEYGRLSGQKAEEKKAGARVEMGDKRNATDFALWKFSPEGAQRDMEWESPWGVGFPGWHLECSAMSKKYLDVPFDIHLGGEDHISVHHENELAQTLGADGELQANVWMHNSFLTVDGGKMSKSLGNLYTLADLKEKGFDPMAFRYFVLGAHYKSNLNFTLESLTAAQNALHKLQDVVREWSDEGERDQESWNAFMEAVNDDLNTAQALAVLWGVVDSDFAAEVKAATVLAFDEVLGLGLRDFVGKQVEIPSEVQQLIDQRDAAREEKNWPRSDELRDELGASGWLVEDTPDGTKVRQKR